MLNWFDELDAVEQQRMLLFELIGISTWRRLFDSYSRGVLPEADWDELRGGSEARIDAAPHHYVSQVGRVQRRSRYITVLRFSITSETPGSKARTVQICSPFSSRKLNVLPSTE